MQDFELDRRQIFQALIALSAVGGLSACAGEQISYPEGELDETEMAMVYALSETILPETETVGAINAGVPATLQTLLTEWGDEEYQSYWHTGLASLNEILLERGGRSFEKLSRADRANVLAAYDTAVFDGDVEDSFYRDFKSTVVQAYCTSERGATETLAYEPVPGEWIGCVPLADYPKNWVT